MGKHSYPSYPFNFFDIIILKDLVHAAKRRRLGLVLSKLSEDLARMATPPSIRPGASVRYSREIQFPSLFNRRDVM